MNRRGLHCRNRAERQGRAAEDCPWSADRRGLERGRRCELRQLVCLHPRATVEDHAHGRAREAAYCSWRAADWVWPSPSGSRRCITPIFPWTAKIARERSCEWYFRNSPARESLQESRSASATALPRYRPRTDPAQSDPAKPVRPRQASSARSGSCRPNQKRSGARSAARP